MRLLTCLNRNSGVLCTQCREIKPHLLARGMCHGISRGAAGTWGIFASYSGDGHSKLHFVQRSQDSCVVMRDTSGIRTWLERIIQTLLEVRWETTCPFLVSRKILVFLSIFKKSQASSPFEALNSVCLSRCQSDVIPPVQMRRRPTAISSVSTGDSDIPSSCDMKHEPKFKPLQGYPAFF